MKYTIRVIRDLKEVEALRPVWEQWQRHPNSDLDHFLLVCRLRGSHPYVIVLDDPDGPVALLAARLEDGQIAPSIGYIKPFRLAVKRLAVINQGLLGEVNDSVAVTLLKGLHEAMARERIDVVELFHLPEDSPLLQAAVAATPPLWRDDQPSWSTHWDLTLPREAGGLLQKMNSKHRYWIRRKMRELEGAYPKCVQYRTFATGERIETLCAALEQVAKLTYQRGLAAGFIDDTEQRARFALFSQRRELRAWTLHVEDVPRAYAVGIVYQGTFHFAMTGYDPEFRRFEIGTLLFLYMIDELIREGVARFDFGLGTAFYKERFGDHSWREGSLRLYRPSVKSLLARTGVGIVEYGASTGRRIAERLGAINKVKTQWRNRISSASKTAQYSNS
jgi:CelD/BcsL family acetyltransferase involved in cellulose biosynthesis